MDENFEKLVFDYTNIIDIWGIMYLDISVLYLSFYRIGFWRLKYVWIFFRMGFLVDKNIGFLVDINIVDCVGFFVVYFRKSLVL